MDKQSDFAARLILASIALGLAGDVLFHGAAGMGVNCLIWCACVLWALAVLHNRAGIPPSSRNRWLGALILVCGILPCLRDSSTIRAGDLGVGLLIAGLLAVYFRQGSVVSSGVLDYLRACGIAFAHSVVFPPAIARHLDFSGANRSGWSRNARAVALGIVVSVPLLIVFASLFMAADPVFAHFAHLLTSWDITALLGHIAMIAGIAWITTGYFRLAFLESSAMDPMPSPAPLLGKIEIATVLGLLNALFAAFVAVQVQYLFGGKAHVLATVHLTYAEYARKGFFELVWAIGLALPVLLVLHQLTQRTDRGADWTYRILSTSLVALLAVVMASAVMRMLLYVNTYGLTELRLYTTAAMGWFGLVFLWFAVTVLQGRRERFAAGALGTGVATLVAVYLINPDALIVRTNLALADRGHPFDGCYAAGLSADAVGPLVDGVGSLPAEQRGVVSYELLHTWTAAPSDWRSWNAGRVAAWNSVQQHVIPLRQFAGERSSDPCGAAEH